MKLKTTSEKDWITLALLFGAVLCVLFYLFATTAGNGALAPSQPDTMMYLQYAKGIATGHPYSYSPGDAPSTGSTSYTYPALLAIFYLFGAKGDHLLVAAFVLNALFYLGTIFMIGQFVRRLHRPALPIALLLTVLCGQLVTVCLGLTDMAMLAFLASSVFTAAIYRRKALFIASLCLLALSRPEGLFFAGVFVFVGTLSLILNRHEQTETKGLRDTFMLAGGLAALCCAGLVFIMNHVLTGHVQFMSVVNKGYFNNYPLAGAIVKTAGDALLILKGYFLGLDSGVRAFYYPPLLTAGLAISGILYLPRDSKTHIATETALALCVGLSVLLIASSQWQGICYDRYLAWITPFWLVYAAIGLDWLVRKLAQRQTRFIVLSFMILFQLGGLAVFAAKFYSGNCVLAQTRDFIRQTNTQIPSEDKIGCISNSGWLYYMQNRVLFNLSGIISPQFNYPNKGSSIFPAIEHLKYNSQDRFDWWMRYEMHLQGYPWINDFFASDILRDPTEISLPDSPVFCPAKWDLIEKPIAPDLPDRVLSGKQLIGTLDIGYLRQHDEYHYKAYCTLKNTQINLTLVTGELEGKRYAEVAQYVMGYEQFTPKVDPNRSLLLVLRTCNRIETSLVAGATAKNSVAISFGSTLKLSLEVDGTTVQLPEFKLNDEGFTDLPILLPSQCFQNSTPTIIIAGEHVSCSFWLYQ